MRTSGNVRILIGMRLPVLLALSLALCSCTPKFEVSVSFRGQIPVLTFQRTGLFSSKDIGVCVWTAEIIDEQTGRPIVRVTSVSPDDCVRLDRLDFGALPTGLNDRGSREPLKRGRAYRAEVTAEQGVGRSGGWSLPRNP